MKLIIKILVINLFIFAIFYIGGSLMNADMNIAKWNEETRTNIFGIALSVVLGVNAVIIGTHYND